MNSTALVLIDGQELDTIQRTGKLLAASGYFDAKGEGAQAVAMMATKILAGREMGFGPFASVNGVHIIQGRPSVGANLMAAAVKGSGRYDYRVREMTDKVCKIEFFQRVGDKLESLGISEFTADDARKAQTKNMDKFPKNMLFARAMSNGVRFYTPDIFSGNTVYVPEELGADVDGEGNVIDVTPTPTPQNGQHGTQAPRTSVPARNDAIVQPRAAVTVESNGDVLFAKESAAPDDKALDIIGTWKSRGQAETWAVDVAKSCANTYEAHNSMNKVLERHGGKVTMDNVNAVYFDFYCRQLEKLEAQQLELAAA